MEKKKNNTWKSVLLFLIGITLIVALIYVVVGRNNSDKEISYTEFQQMVESGEVAEIDVYGYTVRIRKVDGVAENRFPNEVDAYCSFMSVDSLIAFIDSYNAGILEGGLTEGEVLIEANYSYESQSWLSSMLPYLNIILIVVIGFILFKAMSGNSKGFGFGKSKARLVVSSNVKFADVAGAEEEKQELKEIVEFLKNPSRFTELGARIPKGVLLVGQPGTGKTLLAKAVAGESKVPFFSISGSDFVELYVGVGASRVRDLFESAKASAP